jgi:hypothetical protein
MKSVENKKIGIQDAPDYATLIKFCLENSGSPSIPSQTVMKRLRCYKYLDGAGGVMEFEDSDFDCVKEAVMSMVWPRAAQDIGTFIKYIGNL